MKTQVEIKNDEKVEVKLQNEVKSNAKLKFNKIIDDSIKNKEKLERIRMHCNWTDNCCWC